ncbi:tetratricopeptide repeat protein [Limosilactobacillus caccae]|uniref:tetratricopeptide repeat protein n=1 Tax=Limosilactobacillus caccae TaxID=1926284 RepID=UPI0009709FC1|nr:hypothetical protein [Limosilactobacillus caccae]
MARSVFRKPSLKKSFSARYKGIYKRKLKKAFIPGYGTRRAGWMHPQRKLYNKVYYRTSIDTRKLLNGERSHRYSTNRNNSVQGAGCASWLILGFLILAFIISYPVIAVAMIVIIGYFIYRYKHKRIYITTEKVKSTSLPKTDIKPQTSIKKIDSDWKNFSHTPQRHYSELQHYISEKPEIIVKDKKIINVRTGYPLAKQSSIETSIMQFQENLTMPEQNYVEMAQYGYFDTAVENYFIATYLPYYFAGIVAYKRGDWDRAEAWWLSVLNLRPLTVSQKLAIMYRKQKRFEDVVRMYNWSLQFANEPLLRLREDEYQQLISNLEKARKNAAKHKQIDCSLGLREYPNRADMAFIQYLKKISDGLEEDS